MQISTSMRELIAPFYKLKGDFPFVGAYMVTTPTIVATDLDFIKDVLIRDFNYFTDHAIIMNEKDDPLSSNLFTLDGQKWRTLRAKLSPTFTSGRMRFMFPTVHEVADKFNETLGELLKTQKTLEIKDLLARFTTDVIGTCAFGIECNSLKDPNAEFRRYGRKHIEEPAHGRFVTSFVNIFPNLSNKLRIARNHRDVTTFFMGIVQETVEFREKNIRRNDFMDLLIQLKNNASIDEEDSKIIGKITLKEVAAQAFVFFVGGFETSLSTLTFTFYELAKNQNIQDKCRDEINRVLEKYDGKLTYEAMNEMHYVEQTVLETLRKYPILQVNFRKCVKDYHVRGTNVTIEKGTLIQIPNYSIHHDSDIYTDPEKFDPDRFSPENIKLRNSVSFLSFGDGPRNCIGLRFGKMQSAMGLITLLKNYRFKLSSKSPNPLVFSTKSFMLSPEGGMYLDIEKL
ncbi:cytochrome P450 6a9-like [Hermetia illucens]|uniref:cytochrome P450 6a9-like n=1 Tax=Hermetia illucens TaxID=343691 RepID=UPI0018CC1CB2|nr:cytochrome P450 6a9-like [Hermetia illucens]